MRRSRLPLTALRAFEAAGRHESFKRGAAELAVTEAAISRQVRDLESSLGILLFSRDHRAVHLTDKGHDLLARVSMSFDAIDSALTMVAGLEQQSISVSVEPTFANLFLVPALGDFSQLHPDLDVRLEANSTLVDLRAPDGPSLAIRYSLEGTSWPNIEARMLFEDWLTPMVSGKLARTLQQYEDLPHFKLLKDETSNAWTRWLSSAGIEELPQWGPTFSNAATAVQGAEFGQGAVLGNRLLCGRLLRSGRIVAPFDLAIPNGACWIISRDFDKLTDPQAAFVDWLFELAHADVGEKDV
jgi:LysR family glycine cleavage system transcriptional activator